MTDLPCTCLADHKAELASENTELILTWSSDTRRITPTLMARRINANSGAAVTVVPAYCPFCGTAYRKGTP